MFCKIVVFIITDDVFSIVYSCYIISSEKKNVAVNTNSAAVVKNNDDYSTKMFAFHYDIHLTAVVAIYFLKNRYIQDSIYYTRIYFYVRNGVRV